ncbi:hypothetical protein SLAV_01315 [Streptomyces lavendulae subsp. lavendulae]|uniref:Uncharacterized protein n=1 Tax=Streptomyces lavendulae subsp. lavendulae TaxID=58340 RepID=A0A2K8P614_STRLA|nr:hypothetical protein SLAV_01315 [Streptomyces lavendulae subsp. lavendulae]
MGGTQDEQQPGRGREEQRLPQRPGPGPAPSPAPPPAGPRTADSFATGRAPREPTFSRTQAQRDPCGGACTLPVRNLDGDAGTGTGTSGSSASAPMDGPRSGRSAPYSGVRTAYAAGTGPGLLWRSGSERQPCDGPRDHCLPRRRRDARPGHRPSAAAPGRPTARRAMGDGRTSVRRDGRGRERPHTPARCLRSAVGRPAGGTSGHRAGRLGAEPGDQRDAGGRLRPREERPLPHESGEPAVPGRCPARRVRTGQQPRPRLRPRRAGRDPRQPPRSRAAYRRCRRRCRRGMAAGTGDTAASSVPPGVRVPSRAAPPRVLGRTPLARHPARLGGHRGPQWDRPRLRLVAGHRGRAGRPCTGCPPGRRPGSSIDPLGFQLGLPGPARARSIRPRPGRRRRRPRPRPLLAPPPPTALGGSALVLPAFGPGTTSPLSTTSRSAIPARDLRTRTGVRVPLRPCPRPRHGGPVLHPPPAWNTARPHSKRSPPS